jgi:polysaccharide biosynthesis protein VpsI
MSELRVLVSGQDPAMPGGMAKYIEALHEYLPAQPGVTVEFLNETKIKNRVGMRSRGKLHEPLETAKLAAALLSRLRSFKPDVVHLHMAFGFSILEKAMMARLSNRFGTPAVLHLHGSSVDQEIPRWSDRKKTLLQKAFRPPNRVIVLNERMRVLLQSALPAVEISVLPNAVDLIEPQPPLPDGGFSCGFIGFMDGRKGELDLISALASLPAGTCHGIFAGGGEGKRRAEELAEELGVSDRVEFVGFVSGEAKDEFFRRISILCLPSYAENFPISLLEAMAYGRAVIGTTVGGIPEMVEDQVQGFLVPAGSPEELAQGIARLSSDRQMLGRMSDRAYEKVASHYTWKTVGPMLLKIYDEAKQKRGARVG